MAEDFQPLELFIQHYQDLKADHWRSVAIESRPKALARVLALAREYRKGSNWAEQVERYLEDYRLGLVASRGLPLLDARTTCWRVAGPAFVGRMSGSFRLDLPRVHEGDWGQIQWVRLSDETAIDVWALARAQKTTCARILSDIIEEHFNS
jgi:hypothetical protein